MLNKFNLKFNDTEELSASLRHANVRAMQIDRGGFDAHLSRRHVDDWNFQYVSFLKGSSSCAGDAASDRYVFFLPLQFAPGSRLLGQDLLASSVGIYAPGGEHGDVTRPGLSVVVAAPPKELIATLQNLGNELLLPRSGAESRLVSPEKLATFLVVLRRIEQLPDISTIAQPARRAVVDQLTTSFINAFARVEDQASAGRTPLPRGPILRRIAELMKEREGEIILASELALSAGVSQPTLQRVFLDWYGLPPAKHLMLRRLYLARSKLRSRKYDTVSQVAEQCGFIELSRFAKRYKAIFGELPSQTLRSKG